MDGEEANCIALEGFWVEDLRAGQNPEKEVRFKRPGVCCMYVVGYSEASKAYRLY